MAQNAYFGPNLSVFGPKILFLGGREKNFWYPHIRKIKKWTLFLGPKSRFWPKTPIFAIRPQFWSILALGETVHFPPWEQFFDFPFLSYSCFRKKNLVDTPSSFPIPSLWGHRLPVTALAPQREGPSGPRFVLGLDNTVSKMQWEAYIHSYIVHLLEFTVTSVNINISKSGIIKYIFYVAVKGSKVFLKAKGQHHFFYHIFNLNSKLLP